MASIFGAFGTGLLAGAANKIEADNTREAELDKIRFEGIQKLDIGLQLEKARGENDLAVAKVRASGEGKANPIDIMQAYEQYKANKAKETQTPTLPTEEKAPATEPTGADASGGAVSTSPSGPAVATAPGKPEDKDVADAYEFELFTHAMTGDANKFSQTMTDKAKWERQAKQDNAKGDPYYRETIQALTKDTKMYYPGVTTRTHSEVGTPLKIELATIGDAVYNNLVQSGYSKDEATDLANNFVQSYAKLVVPDPAAIVSKNETNPMSPDFKGGYSKAERDAAATDLVEGLKQFPQVKAILDRKNKPLFNYIEGIKTISGNQADMAEKVMPNEVKKTESSYPDPSKYSEGKILKNPDTNERIKLVDGKWVKL